MKNPDKKTMTTKLFYFLQGWHIAIFFVCMLQLSAAINAEEATDADPLQETVVDATVSTPDTQKTATDPQVVVQQDETPSLFFRFLDDHQKLISSRLHQIVQGTDNFFANSDSIDENTGSYLRLSIESAWLEGQGFSSKPGINLKVRLPKTQKKVKLVFESEADEKRNTLDRATRETPTTDSQGQDNSYVAGLEGEFGRPQQWKFRPSIGLRLSSPLDPYVKFRADRHEYFTKWALYLNETLYWYDSSGFGSDTTMRWDRKLDEDLLLRFNSFIRYTDENDYYELSQTVGLIQTLSPKQAITYQFGVFGISEPSTHVTTYLLNAVYRYNLHKDYLFMDVQPQVLFERENDFDSHLELLLRLEIFYRD